MDAKATERLAWTIPEYAASIGVSRAKAYQMADSGEIPVIRFGGRLLVPVDAARDLFARRLAEQRNVESAV